MAETNITIDFDTRVSIPDHVLFRELDGEAVMLNLEDESYYGLDEVGTRMWTVLSASKNIAEAHNSLIAEYDVDAEQLAADMVSFVRELHNQGLVVIE